MATTIAGGTKQLIAGGANIVATSNQLLRVLSERSLVAPIAASKIAGGTEQESAGGANTDL